MQNTRRSLAIFACTCLCLAGASTAGDSTAATPAATARPAGTDKLLMGTDDLRTFGMQSAWQTALPMMPGVAWLGAKSSDARGDAPTGAGASIYGWDAAGALISLDAGSGTVRWQSAGLGRSERVVDVVPALIDGREVAIMLGNVNYAVIDSRSGEIAGFSDYKEIPATPASMFGSECIYGSASRKLVWTRFETERVPPRAQPKLRPGIIKEVVHVQDVGSRVVMRQIRAMQVHGTMDAAPVGGAHDALVVSTSRGELLCVNKDSGAVLWQTRLAGGVQATPAIAMGMLYVGSKDQYMRAFDIASGRTLWKWFAPAELDNPPTVAGDLLLVQVPETGLAALHATNTTKPDGDLVWIGDKVRGNAVTRNREGIICWDAATATLSLVDDRTGGVRTSIQLSGITAIWSNAPVNGNLIMLSSDGRVQHCRVAAPMAVETPRATVAAATKPAAAPEAAPEADKEAPADADAPKPDA